MILETQDSTKLQDNIIQEWSKDGQTPLHNADFQLSTVLIQHGADVRTKDVDLKTPLHCAIQRNDLKTVELLIQHGAAVNARAYDRSTPLQIAAIENDSSKIVEDHSFQES